MAEAEHVPSGALECLASIEGQKRYRIRMLVLAAIGAAPVAASAAWKLPMLLVWNASSSAPVGLYRVDHAASLRRGDTVIAWAPLRARALAARRHYLPSGVPLVKRIAAAAGDRTCAQGLSIRINGKLAATRLKRDVSGRAMPWWWQGCRILRPHEYLLLTDNRQSFDGRYFGITRKSDLIGRAAFIWPRARRDRPRD
jgi:conjugative transfer signal peptidase TraF